MYIGFFVMLVFDNVTYCYRPDSKPALRDVSFRIGTGESVSVMGSNGSGKSTLALLIASLLKPQQGSLRLDDTVSDAPIGLLFQNPDNQFVAVTVEKEIAYALENQSCPLEEMERRITEVLESFSIEHLRRSLISQLSGGEKQRVALASVIVLNPAVLVLDEPDSFLDLPGRMILEQELMRLRRKVPQMIQIHITQYPEAARSYSRLILFHKARLVADCSPSEILDDKEFCQSHGLCSRIDNSPKSSFPALPARPADFPSQCILNEIEVSNIRYHFPDSEPLLKDVSFVLRPGYVLGMVGPSGCGKTTLAHIVCRLLMPNSGLIRYTNGSGSEIEPKYIVGQLILLFQQPERQFFLSTCKEEIFFGPLNLGLELTEGEAAEFADSCGLNFDEFAGRDPISLSAGEKRRLAFAVLLAMSPKFVIFDEPTCGLDPEGVGRFIELARQLRDKGTGMIIISHDGSVISSLADEIICLSKGASPRVESADEFLKSSGSKSVLAVYPAGQVLSKFE